MAKARNTFSDKRPYKVYTALLTQTGTNAPTSIVLENTFGYEPTITYQSVGIYYVTFNSSIKKRFCLANNNKQESIFIVLNDLTDGETFEISSNSSSVLSNNIIDNLSIEIREYN